MISVHAVPPEMARQVGELLKPLIERAWSRMSFPMEEGLLADCERRLAVFWVLAKGTKPVGMVITRNVTDEGEHCIRVVAASGIGVGPWMRDVRARLHEFRKAEGAACLLCIGRKGWERVLDCSPIGRDMTGQYIFKDYGNARR